MIRLTLDACMKAVGVTRYQLAKRTDADMVIFDPKREWKIDRFASKSQNSPFVNVQLKGKVEITVSDGKIVFSDWE